jgi:hypothetical protein
MHSILAIQSGGAHGSGPGNIPAKVRDLFFRESLEQEILSRAVEIGRPEVSL